MKNLIKTADFKELFDISGIGDPLITNPHLFSFSRYEMPLALSYEQQVLAALTRVLKAECIVEFGTAEGVSTYTLAANMKEGGIVHTVDIEGGGDYKEACLRGDTVVGRCHRESPYAERVQQYFRKDPMDRITALECLKGSIDLIHVDADHSYKGVSTDTEEALTLSHEETVFLWHDFYPFPDYIEQGPERRGVYPYLNELATKGDMVLRRITGTYFVVGCRAWREEETPGVLYQPDETPAPFGRHNVRLWETSLPEPFI